MKHRIDIQTTKTPIRVVLLLVVIILVAGRYRAACGQERRQVNYDESNVPEYTLPALFTASGGDPVHTVKAWEYRRREEIVRLFEEHVYGSVPDQFDSIRFEEANARSGAMDGSADLKEIDIEVARNGQSVTIRLVLFVPNGVPRPAPVFLLINHRGPENMDPSHETRKEFWPAETIVDRGYTAAVFDVEDVADDNNETFAKDVIEKLYPEQLDRPDGMRTLSAWVWGAMRVMDYLVRDPDIDPQRSVVVGHSRGGKTALWTGAQDQRWAITVSNESGAGGAALSRRRFGETVGMINRGFPYWFTPKFSRYNENESELPVDQHMLIACMAPRPVYVGSAEKDSWADPKGEFLSLKHAGEVYQKIYRLPVRLPQTMPEVNRPVIKSYAGYHIRSGEHDLTLYDWHRFMDFADYHFEIDR